MELEGLFLDVHHSENHLAMATDSVMCPPGPGQANRSFAHIAPPVVNLPLGVSVDALGNVSSDALMKMRFPVSRAVLPAAPLAAGYFVVPQPLRRQRLGQAGRCWPRSQAEIPSMSNTTRTPPTLSIQP